MSFKATFCTNEEFCTRMCQLHMRFKDIFRSKCSDTRFTSKVSHMYTLHVEIFLPICFPAWFTFTFKFLNCVYFHVPAVGTFTFGVSYIELFATMRAELHSGCDFHILCQSLLLPMSSRFKLKNLEVALFLS